jgi:hypothetical protein
MAKVILLILLVSSCATSYQKKANNDTGYLESKVTKDVYNVRYEDEEVLVARNRFLKRCAEIAQKNDKIYFCSVRVKRKPAGHQISPGLGFNTGTVEDDIRFMEGNIQLTDDQFDDRECHMAGAVLREYKERENR